jgi:hypothetical protein
MTTLIRLFLTATLIYFIYTQIGWAVALFAFLVAMGFEAVGLILMALAKRGRA